MKRLTTSSLTVLVSLWKVLSLVEAFRTDLFVCQKRLTYHDYYSTSSRHPSTTRSSLLVLRAAKNKKGKNKNKNKKRQKQQKNQQKSGFAWASSVTLKPYEAQSLRELASLAISSFEGRTGKPLSTIISKSGEGTVPVISSTSNDPPKALWTAPIACVIVGQPPPPDHGEGSVPPTGNSCSSLRYANLAALEMVNLQAEDFERFCPMSASITQFHVNEEDPIPDAVVTLDLPSQMKGTKKYERGYQKKVIRKQKQQTGEINNNNNNNNTIPPNDDDITILNAHRWVLEKTIMGKDGTFETTTMGVAYAWEEWQLGESIICGAGGGKQPRILINVKELQAQLDQQATLVRNLKEQHGLTNQDPQVMDAVKTLLQLKDQIAASSS